MAIRGPLTAKMRELAETACLSFARLLGDTVLVYDARVEARHKTSTSLADRMARQEGQRADT